MDWQSVEGCLAQVEACKASGQRARVWAQANGVALRELSSGFAHARGWRVRLNGAGAGAGAGAAALDALSGFVAARVIKDKPQKAARDPVRIELQAGTTAVALQLPTTHPRERAAGLRAPGR